MIFTYSCSEHSQLTMNNTTEIDLSLLLHKILMERKERNQNYSIRAFARDLKISSGRMSDILNKKYIPGNSISSRIVQALCLNEEEGKIVQQIIENSQKSKKELGGAHQLSEQEYSLIADWHHYAILNLMETKDYRDDFSWIADRLNLNQQTVKDSFDIMISLGLVEIKNGKYLRTHKNVTTTHNIPSRALREANRQVIMQSLNSLVHDPTDIRDITSIVLPINMANLPKAKELAREFRRKVAALLEEGEKTEVYNVCVQIVPVTRTKKS